MKFECPDASKTQFDIPPCGTPKQSESVSLDELLDRKAAEAKRNPYLEKHYKEQGVTLILVTTGQKLHYKLDDSWKFNLIE